jgi:rubrerythrin
LTPALWSPAAKENNNIMMTTKRVLTAIAGVAALVTTGALAAGTAQAANEKTLSNLQAAYNGESNAHARYLAFAKKADQEGYAGVASLFRGAARAEQIHAANHAVVIKKLGATPQAKIETPAPKSTRENLEAAIKGETYERDEMYPAFLKQARQDGNADALQTLNYAKNAEVEHAKLYTAALGDVENMRSARSWYVCPVCGFTTAKVDFARCPSSFTPANRYEKIS